MTMRTMRAAIAVLRPHEGIFECSVDAAVLHTTLSFVPYLSLPMRWGLPVGLLFLEFAPVLFKFGMRRFSRMDVDTARSYLRRFEETRGPFLLLHMGLRGLVLMSFYQQPEILEALEIRWQGRADELTERRARLLRMAPELGNPKNAGRAAR
jgi:hypothetical protein